jgi:plastocyanin
MTRTRTFLLVATLALLAALVAALPAHAALPKLVGTVGPGFTITLKQGGKNVATVKRGKYALVVSDRSPMHNFHLVGPGVNVKTTVAATGTKTFTVTLKPGRYTFLCDPHPSAMKRTFRVA